jgi:hypothetical protein
MAEVIVDENDARILREMRAHQQSLIGSGVSNSPGSAAFANFSRRRPRVRRPRLTLPTGQYTGMFYGDVAAQQGGFAYIFAINTV